MVAPRDLTPWRTVKSGELSHRRATPPRCPPRTVPTRSGRSGTTASTLPYFGVPTRSSGDPPLLTYGNGCGSGLSGRYLNIFQNKAPTLRCRPDLVHGMPVARDTRRFALVMPNWRFQLHPPLFISDTPFRMDRRAGRNGAGVSRRRVTPLPRRWYSIAESHAARRPARSK